MKRGWALALALALACGLGGCGFQPLYGQGGGNSDAGGQLALINVALIPDRVGQQLREALQERLEAAGEGVSSRYDLYVAVSMGPSAIGIDQQTASTRTRVVGSATWTLKAEDAAHTVITSGSAHALDGFDVINQQFFAADMSQDAAFTRIDQTLADQITQQLAVYFRTHAAPGAG
jgi:LPS-assembly lipoprotein